MDILQQPNATQARNIVIERIKHVLDITKYPALFLIRIYQKTISPDHGMLLKKMYPQGYCKYNPTCSEYTYQAIDTYGLIKGIGMGSWRIMRCNPWSHGGEDPLR